MAMEKNIKWEKSERGSNIISPIISWLLGRRSNGKVKRGQELWRRKTICYKNGDGEEYKVVGNFIHPCSAQIKILSDH